MIRIDFEAKSLLDITKVGAWVYTLHHSTEIIVCRYQIGDGPIHWWWPGMKLRHPEQVWPKVGSRFNRLSKNMPYDLYLAISRGDKVEAHNVSMELSVIRNICVPQFGWVEPKLDQWVDSQAAAAYYAMPAALDKLSKAIGYEGKDKRGGQLITKYSKLYLKTAKTEIPPDDFLAFGHYCGGDVEQEALCSEYLGPLPQVEQETYLLDLRMNLRGVYLNEKSIRDAAAVVEKRSDELRKQFVALTGVNPTQDAKIKEWAAQHGTVLENMQAEYLEELLDTADDTMHDDVFDALEVRIKFNKASTKKLDAMLRQRDATGRARFQTKYHGAVTGRSTGAGFQPLNLTKSYEDVDPLQLLEDIGKRDPELLDRKYGDAMDAVSKASRHHIQAERGNRLIAGDYVSVEAVLLACLAEETWKIEAFRNGDPIYEIMACDIHNLDEAAKALARQDKSEFKKQFPGERFDGKTGELAFGYQGNLGAWRKFDSSDRHTDDAIKEICKAWRSKNPATVALWEGMERAAHEALTTNEDMPVITDYRDADSPVLVYGMRDDWLSLKLPDGKRIWYYKPEMRMAMPPWHDPEEDEECASGCCECKPRPQLTYLSYKNGQFIRVSTYGGKLTENAVQATSRQVLIPAMKRLEAAGYPLILSVYDEIVAEVPNGFGSVEEFPQIMAQSSGEWMDRWPISVDAWEGPVYKK